MSKPWGGVGAWALDAERAEEEEERELAAASAASASSFPSLKEAAAVGGGGKSKKKKGTTLSLSEFTTYGATSGSRSLSSEPKGLTPDEMLRLPTGPRERTADELDRSRLGGGFRSYGGVSGGGRFGRSDDGDGYRRGGGSFDDDSRRGPPSRLSDFDMPSRADEVDNWAANKKTSFSQSPMDSGRRDRYSSLGTGIGGGGGGGGGFSRADETDDWSRGKKPLPSRYPSLGSGFRDSAGPSDSDRWTRAAPLHDGGERERRPLVLEPPKRDVAATAPPAEPTRTRPSPFGAARPREEVLAQKGLDWRKMETEIEQKKTSRPTSSQSSRPNSAHSSRPGSPGSQVSTVGSEGAPRARPKVNPFGDAKPRELVLQEKGKDWRKIDRELEHRRIDRPETTEEKNLKEGINHLKEELKETEAKISDGSDQASAEDAKSLHERISQMEEDLELLTIELDDKVRFGQRTSEVRPGSGAGRPGSGAGRVTTFPQAGLSEEPRVPEAMERPHSRGSTGEPWPRPIEDKWGGFQGSRDRGYFGSRTSDRSLSRERW